MRLRRQPRPAPPPKLGLQGRHYKPLRSAFNAAMRRKSKAPAFLSLCEAFVREGKLVAGWNDYRPLVDNKWEGDNAKGKVAGEKAAAYDALIRAGKPAPAKGM